MLARLLPIALVTASAAATARGELFLSYLVNTDLTGSAPFTSSADVAPGQTVLVRMYIYWSYPKAIYFGGLELTSIPLEGANSDDLIDLRAGDPQVIQGGLVRSVFGTKTISWIYGQKFSIKDVSGSRREIVTDSTVHPMTLLQDVASRDADFNPENPIWSLQFQYTPAPGQFDRDITIGGTNDNVRFAAVYTSLSGLNHVYKKAERTLVPATVHVTPAPGAMGLLGVCVFGCRRRRAGIAG